MIKFKKTESDEIMDHKVIIVKERRPVGLPAKGNKRHGVQGSTPVSEGCDRYHPLLLP